MSSPKSYIWRMFGWLDASDRLRFLGEAADEGGVLGVIGRQDLYGDVAVEVGVECPEHGCHAAAAELLDDPVPAEAAARRYGYHQSVSLFPQAVKCGAVRPPGAFVTMDENCIKRTGNRTRQP